MLLGSGRQEVDLVDQVDEMGSSSKAIVHSVHLVHQVHLPASADTGSAALVVTTLTKGIAGCGLQLARMGQRQLNAVEPERNIAKTCTKRKRVFLPWLKPEVSNAEAL